MMMIERFSYIEQDVMNMVYMILNADNATTVTNYAAAVQFYHDEYCILTYNRKARQH